MIKGIIFDVDGTTLNTLVDIQESVNITLKNAGFNELSLEKVRLSLGRGSRNLIKDSIPQDSSDEYIDELTNKYLDVYSKHYNVKTKPYEGIKELINELEKRNMLLGINSNKPNNYTIDLINYHFPNNKFIAIFGSRKNIPIKPDPYSANQILEMMKLDKSEVLYVGDSESDVATGKNAGLKVVGCLWGYRDIETLTSAGADFIIKQPKELLNYLN